MAKAPPSPENLKIAERLIRLRQAVAPHASQILFANTLGVEFKRWNNFERGSPLSKEVAIILVQKIPGLTLDWLFLGHEDGLSLKLHRQLMEVGNVQTTSEGGTVRK